MARTSGGAGESSGGVARSRSRVIEAHMSWVASLVLFFCTVYMAIQVDLMWTAFGIAALSLYVLPMVSMRDPFRALPWEMTILLSSPIILHISEGTRALSENLAWWDDFTSLAFAFSLATLGFLLTVELQMYTDVRMNRPFASFFVVMFTLAVSGFWQIGEYLSDVFFDTSNILSNDLVMREFLWAAVGGLLMGFVYSLYMNAMSKSRGEVLGFIHLWEVPKWRRG